VLLLIWLESRQRAYGSRTGAKGISQQQWGDHTGWMRIRRLEISERRYGSEPELLAQVLRELAQ